MRGDGVAPHAIDASSPSDNRRPRAAGSHEAEFDAFLLGALAESKVDNPVLRPVSRTPSARRRHRSFSAQDWEDALEGQEPFAGDDCSDVSSLSDGEADRATVTAPAPARAEPSLCGVRAGKYSSWPRSEALGAALVIDRCAGGDVDIRSVVLDFLENGLVLSHTFEYGEISFKANLPAMVCWSCRRKISKEHDSNLEFFSGDDVPSCDADAEVMRSCLCLSVSVDAERSEECKRGYARLVPELVRATGLWREHAAAHENPYEPPRYLAANTYDCDFFDVIGELHPSSLWAMRAAGWAKGWSDEWRCES